MKTIKLFAILEACSLLAGNLSAQTCNTNLGDTLGPSGGIYEEDDTIEYVITLKLTDPTDCPVKNIKVYFFPPNITPDNVVLCNSTNGILIYDGGPSLLNFGDPDIVLDSSVSGAESLAYLVKEADADASGLLYAYICTKFDAVTNLGDLPNSDTKSAVNKVIAWDFMVNKSCVDPNGTLIGEDVEFQITITNTGDVELSFLDTGTELDAYEPIVLPPASEAPANVFQTTVTKPSTGECDDDQIVSNEVEIEAYYNGLLVGTKTADVNCPVLCPPAFTVDKICLTNPIMNEPNALFEIIIKNTGYVDLEFEIDDIAAGIEDMIVGPVLPGGEYRTTVEVPAECINGEVSNRVIVQAYFDGSPVLDPMPKDAVCPCLNEGCTPGFWKNHTNCWACYSSTTKLKDVFTIPSALSSLKEDTLLKALNYGGGSGVTGAAKILLRAAVSAILNACDEDVNYPLTVAEVKAKVKKALATNNRTKILKLATELDMLNNLGCPIDAHCIRKDSY